MEPGGLGEIGRNHEAFWWWLSREKGRFDYPVAATVVAPEWFLHSDQEPLLDDAAMFDSPKTIGFGKCESCNALRVAQEFSSWLS